MMENGWTKKIAELEAENTALRDLITRRMTNEHNDVCCWCRYDGGYMNSEHSETCLEAQALVRKWRGE